MTKFIVSPTPASSHKMMDAVDVAFDDLLGKLECHDGTDAELISHWQGNGFRIQVDRKTDGRSLSRFVRADGVISL
jgi:hypothetical protein